MTEPHDVLEALLFASDTPVDPGLIQEVLELASPEAARELVDELRRRFDEQGRVLQIIEAGGGFRMVTRPEVAPWLVKLARSKTKSRLSRPALETLAIIAYRQPVSRPEVDATRGVNSEGVLDNLLERRLVRIAGRKETAGRPFLYETTREFLVAFGLRDLGDLPKVDGELVMLGTSPSAETAVGEPASDVDAPADEDSAHASAAEMDTALDASDATAIEEDAQEAVTGGSVAEASEDARGGFTEGADDDVVVVESASAAIVEVDAPGRPAALVEITEVVAVVEHAEPSDTASSDEDVSAATDPSQQDPRAGGTELAPRG